MALSFSRKINESRSDFIVFDALDDKALKVEDRYTIETVKTNDKGLKMTVFVNKTDKVDNLFVFKRNDKNDPPAPKITYNKTSNFVSYIIHRRRITLDKSGQDKIISCPSHNDWSYSIYNKTDGKNLLWDPPQMWDVKIFGDCSVAAPDDHAHFYHKLNKSTFLMVGLITLLSNLAYFS